MLFRRSSRRLLLALLAVATSAAALEDIAGIASAIDGDTLEIHGSRIRLWGVDAPEGKQVCDRNGEAWRCGQAAALALADRIGSTPVWCKWAERDKYGRALAVCYVDGLNLNRWLVSEGWAMDYNRYSQGAYAAAEASARRERRGIWSSRFTPPWKWRRQR